MIQIPCDSIRAALNDDFEFRHAARYWDAHVRLGIGDRPLCVRIAQGRVEEMRPWAEADTLDVGIDAPTHEWKELLATEPRPFYQNVFAAATHHELVLSGNPIDTYTYIGALTRMIDVFRDRVEFQ